MRVLFWFCDRMAWTPSVKTLPEVEDGEPGSASAAVAAFVHVEPQDEGKSSKVETKLVKNVKWLAGKWNTRTVVLHTFTHLAEEKADPVFARDLLARVRKRLEEVGYLVTETPYGHFNDLELAAPGHPLARIFKQL
jgi:hypothetical protein